MIEPNHSHRLNVHLLVADGIECLFVGTYRRIRLPSESVSCDLLEELVERALFAQILKKTCSLGKVSVLCFKDKLYFVVSTHSCQGGTPQNETFSLKLAIFKMFLHKSILMIK